MESFNRGKESHGSPQGLRSRSRTRSPGSAPGSEAGQSSPRRWSTRSRSMGKLKEWGEYAEHICAERQLRREQQALLEVALHKLQELKNCPFCSTRGRLRDWEQWTENIAVEMEVIEMGGRLGLSQASQARIQSGCEGGWQPGYEGGPHPLLQPFSGLWRLPAPVPWGSRGGGCEDPHVQ